MTYDIPTVGGCPICHQHDGLHNIGPDHWFACHAHKRAWMHGSRIFPQWASEHEERWIANGELLSGYKKVIPYYPVRPVRPVPDGAQESAVPCGDYTNALRDLNYGDMPQDGVQEEPENKLPADGSGFLGGCPTCGCCDGFVNIGREQWCMCHQHRKKWCAGCNIFSDWRTETTDTWYRNFQNLASYEEVEPA